MQEDPDDVTTTPSAWTRGSRPLLLVLFIGCVLYLPCLGLSDFRLAAEARVGQAARQMLRSGDWLVPRIGDDLRLKKPPLAYWLAALSATATGGVDEWSVRLPNACAGIGVLLLVYLFGARFFSPRAGLFAAFALGTTVYVWIQARSGGIEMPLLFLNMLILYAALRARETGPRRGAWLLLAYAGAGAAFLEKGPVGPCLVLLILLLHALASRWGARGEASGVVMAEPAPLSRRWHAAGAFLFAAIALPWYVAVWRLHPEALYIWLGESIGRFEGVDHRRSILFIPAALLLDGQPWILFALFAPLAWKSADGRFDRRYLLPAAWLAAVVLFFALPADKKHSYLLPAYPAVALLAAGVLDAALEGRRALLRRLLTRTGFVYGLVGLAAAALLLFAGFRPGLWEAVDLLPAGLPALHSALVLLALLAAGLLACLAARGRVLASAGALALLAATGFACAVAFDLPRDREPGYKSFARQIGSDLKRAERVYVLDFIDYHIFSYYLDRDVEPLSSADPDAPVRLNSARPGAALLLTVDDPDNALPPALASCGVSLDEISESGDLRAYHSAERRAYALTEAEVEAAAPARSLNPR